MEKYLLIADDSAMVTQLISVTLEAEGYDILEASSGAQAVSVAREVGPEVVVLDVTMPGSIDGLRACEVIKSDDLLKDTYVVMVSARGSREDIARAMQAGADAYLVKPFSPKRLIDIIQSRRPWQAG